MRERETERTDTNGERISDEGILKKVDAPKCTHQRTNIQIITKLYTVIQCLILKPQSHQAYDQVTAYLRPKNGPIVERTYDWSQRSYDWSQRSWVIARGKSVAARSWSC